VVIDILTERNIFVFFLQYFGNEIEFLGEVLHFVEKNFPYF